MPGCQDFTVQIWHTIFAFLVRFHGPVKHTSVLRIAATSKTLRERVIDFWNTSLSITRDLEAIVSSPARILNPRDGIASLPASGILNPRHVSELAQSRHRGPCGHPCVWSILHRANSARIVTDSVHSDLALLSRLAPCTEALSVTFNAPNVSFGPSPLVLDTAKCLIINRVNLTELREPRAPVAGSIRCPRLTHLAFSGTSHGIHDFECIDAPRLTHLLLGSAPDSFAGIQRLTALRSLAITDTGTGPVQHIDAIAHLAHLSTLYIGLSSREHFLRFISVTPSLTKLVSLTVCTPRGAEDMFLYHARACLTALEHLGLVGLTGLHGLSGLSGLSGLNGFDPRWPTIPASLSTEPHLYGLPDSIGLRKLEVHCAWYRSWCSWHGLSQITELCLDGIHLVRSPTTTAPLPVTSLLSIGLPSMVSLTVLKISDLQHLRDLSVVYALAARTKALSTLVVTRCTGLTSAGCTRLGSMYSLTELSLTACGLVTLPSLCGLSRLVNLHIDLHDNEDYTSCVDTAIDDEGNSVDSSCFTKIPEIPLSLRRLRFNSENGSQALGRPQLEYMGSLMTTNPHLTELSISYWDKTWFWGIGAVPHYQNSPCR